MNQSENSEVYSARCREINNENGVRFAAIINHDGIRIAGGFRDGITPLEGDEQKLHE